MVIKAYRLVLLFACIWIATPLVSAENTTLFLRDNLQRAKPGDYLIVSANKTDTLMHIYDKEGTILTIEEIAIPESKRAKSMNWAAWVQQQAPGNTSWVMYEIDLRSGHMLRYYSFTKQGWFEIPDSDNLLSKLLNLKLQKVPDYARKKIGPRTNGPDFRPLWQPPLIVEGKPIKGVLFDAWRTTWPKDNTELSGKMIEVYLPQDNQRYPSYFPYWLQISGVAGKAKIRIIDSGFNLKSPKPPLDALLKKQ